MPSVPWGLEPVGSRAVNVVQTSISQLGGLGPVCLPLSLVPLSLLFLEISLHSGCMWGFMLDLNSERHRDQARSFVLKVASVTG